MTGLLLAALTVLAGQAPPAPRLDGITTVDAKTPAAIQIALAESAGPPVGKEAAIYILGRRGYTKARDGRNGFTCLISRERPDTLEPECFDGEGTRTVVPVRMFIEEQRAAGTAEPRIQALVERATRAAASRRPASQGSSTCSRITTTSSIRTGRP